jgi:hypothetical protein
MIHHSENRRSFLKAAGVCLALPTLESMKLTSCINAAESSPTEQLAPQRMVCIGNEFGMHPGSFWPKQTGADYELTSLLKPLTPHKSEFTLFSHLDHGLKGGHFAIHAYLTGVKAAEARGLPGGGMSLDQRAAEFVGSRTRFPSLTIVSDYGLHGGCQMSWTRTGTRIPPIPGPRELFRQLFVDDSAAGRKQAEDRIALQSSILDAVLGDANSLRRKLNKNDGQKLDEYFSSVRDVETKLTLDRQWLSVPKPKAPMDEPTDKGLTLDLPALYDLIALALQTDSTRVATLEIASGFVASALGIKKGYHGLSHHGKVEDSIDLLVQIELYQVEQLSRFLAKLRSIREPNTDGTLLDNTMVLMGSGMGDANSHTNNDLPIILAGGRFKHGEYKQYPKVSNRRVPLCNLFVSMLQRFGVETDEFSQGTGTLNGLELA